MTPQGGAFESGNHQLQVGRYFLSRRIAASLSHTNQLEHDGNIEKLSNSLSSFIVYAGYKGKLNPRRATGQGCHTFDRRFPIPLAQAGVNGPAAI